jgi:hypothetical protein
MAGAPLQVELGTVETLLGNLRFTFVVNAEGDGHVQVYATDPSDLKKKDIVVMLDAGGYERLKTIIKETDAVIDRMIRAGRIKKMVLPY